MSKVTGKDLQRLIEGVLNEKITNNLVDPPADLYSKQKPPKNTIPQDDNEQAWARLGVAKTTIPKKSDSFEVLAATDGSRDQLSVEDLQQAIKDMVERTRAGKKPAKNTYAARRDKAIATMKKGADSGIQSAIDAITQDTLGSIELEPEEMKALLGDIQNYFDELEYQDVSAFSDQGIGYKAVETSESDFDSNIRTKVSPYLLDLFGGIDGTSVKEKLNSIAEFSKAAEKLESLQVWATGKDQFSPFIYSKVLSFLANEIKTLGAKEAGNFFERWLALLLNFPVVGAEGGAADNLGKVGADTIYTSSKLYSDLVGEYAPSQSTAGLKEITKNGANKIYYFVGQKKKADDQKTPGFTFIPSIDLYLVEISEVDDQLQGRFIKDNASKASKHWDLVQKSDTQSYLLPTNYTSGEAFTNNLFTTVYLPEGEITDQAIETTAKFLAKQVAGLKDQPATKAIMDAATKIKTIEANTDSYVGKSKQKKGSATEYIKKITTDYLALDGLYDQIFKYGQGDEQAEISEQKITKEHILKLIEESFNK